MKLTDDDVIAMVRRKCAEEGVKILQQPEEPTPFQIQPELTFFVVASIGDIQRDMEKARKDVPTMEFDAIVEQLAYKDGDTVLVMIVSADVVAQLNTNRHILKHYKIELIRE